MNTQIDIHDLDTLNTNILKIAEFIALFESAEEKLKERENALEQRIVNNEHRLNEQLVKISSVFSEFQSVMTEVGAARWRIVAEKTLQQSEEHLKNIRYATDEFIRCSAESYERLNKATDYTVKGLSKTIHSFRMEDFQRVTTMSIETVSNACVISLDKIKNVISWFHWRNIALVFSITIVVTMITGLYINDEWPWQSHQKMMQQRQLALAVEAAWPQLSVLDQQEILHVVTENIA